MVAYGIEIISLIKCLKSTYPDVTQPWYADDDGALGMFDNLEQYFNSLKHKGPAWGYYPDPNKIIMIVRSNNIEEGGCLYSVMGLRCA